MWAWRLSNPFTGAADHVPHLPFGSQLSLNWVHLFCLVSSCFSSNTPHLCSFVPPLFEVPALSVQAPQNGLVRLRQYPDWEKVVSFLRFIAQLEGIAKLTSIPHQLQKFLFPDSYRTFWHFCHINTQEKVLLGSVGSKYLH